MQRAGATAGVKKYPKARRLQQQAPVENKITDVPVSGMVNKSPRGEEGNPRPRGEETGEKGAGCSGTALHSLSGADSCALRSGLSARFT